MITAKYLKTHDDYINLVCVSKELKELLQMFHFNPIPVESLTLFPNMESQYLYSKEDKRIEGLHQYFIWYSVSYDEMIKQSDPKNIYKNLIFTTTDTSELRNKYKVEPYSKKPVDVIIPNGITSLGSRCFSTMTLGLINIPTSITSFGNLSFFECTSLRNIELPNRIYSIGNSCFDGCVNLQQIIIPDSVFSIGKFCFDSCSKLSAITLSKYLGYLGRYSFDNCVSLQSISIPSSLQSISDGLFHNCRNLHTINIPTAITSFGKHCIDGCSKLTSFNNTTELNKLFQSALNSNDEIKSTIN
ncbi:Leucine rich repeat protein bspa family [Entamoeba marina]